MVCDWLLTTRTELWEKNSKDENTTASQTEMIAFQQDLNSLRKLAQAHKNILSKVILTCIKLVQNINYQEMTDFSIFCEGACRVKMIYFLMTGVLA